MLEVKPWDTETDLKELFGKICAVSEQVQVVTRFGWREGFFGVCSSIIDCVVVGVASLIVLLSVLLLSWFFVTGGELQVPFFYSK